MFIVVIFVHKCALVESCLKGKKWFFIFDIEGLDLAKNSGISVLSSTLSGVDDVSSL